MPRTLRCRQARGFTQIEARPAKLQSLAGDVPDAADPGYRLWSDFGADADVRHGILKGQAIVIELAVDVMREDLANAIGVQTGIEVSIQPVVPMQQGMAEAGMLFQRFELGQHEW